MDRTLLKVGDEVVFTKERPGLYEKGDEAEVLKIESDAHAGYYSVQVLKGHAVRWISENDIELIPAKTGYIVWSPDSDEHFRVISTLKQARHGARTIAKQQGGSFYVAKLTTKYSRNLEVIKEDLQ